jgi:transposase InsO family protein
MGQNEFEQLCADFGIEHRLMPPMRPQTNGMVERFNDRSEDVIRRHRFPSGEKLEQTILCYVKLYNHQLPRSALASKTPLQAMKYWHKLRLEQIKKQHNTLRDAAVNFTRCII